MALLKGDEELHNCDVCHRQFRRRTLIKRPTWIVDSQGHHSPSYRLQCRPCLGYLSVLAYMGMLADERDEGKPILPPVPPKPKRHYRTKAMAEAAET